MSLWSRSICLLAFAGLAVPLLALPASATVIATGGYFVSSNCGQPGPESASGASYAQIVGSQPTGNWTGEWDVEVTPTLATSYTRATKGPDGFNNSTCVPGNGRVEATDLTFSSTGGTGPTIDVRVNLDFTSDWNYNSWVAGWNESYQGTATRVELGGYATPGGVFYVIPGVSGPPGGSNSGSSSACYQTSWITMPVGTPLNFAYILYGASQVGTGGLDIQTSTMTPGCGGGDFIEIQQAGFTYDSAELGIVNGQFAVPEPAAAGLVLTGLVGLSLRRRAAR